MSFLAFALIPTIKAEENGEGDLEGELPPEDSYEEIDEPEITFKSNSETTYIYRDSPSPPFDYYRWWDEDFG